MKSRSRFLQIVNVLGLIAGFCAGPRALGMTTNVTVSGFAFNPPTVSIAINDTVKWNFAEGGHTTTRNAGPPLWDSGTVAVGQSFSFQFTSTGNFGYFCFNHSFMTGSVDVSGANQPPTVSINSPSNGSVFAAPWPATLKATASDPDAGGSVSKVQFFTNNVSAGAVSNAPFNLAIGNLNAGSYVVKAVATDNLGATNTSTSITFTVVTPVAVTITNPALLSATQFKLTYSANPGLRYVVERSSNLFNFHGINTNTAASSSVTFTDSAAGPDQGYYRVGRLPNP